MTARMTPLQPRLKSPDSILPDLRAGIPALIGTVFKSGLPRSTAELVHLRVSQVNGCAPCIDSGWRTAKKAGESDERLFNVAAWRHAPYYSDAERDHVHHDEREDEGEGGLAHGAQCTGQGTA